MPGVKTKPEAVQVDDRLLTVSEVANKLRVSKQQVCNLCRDGRLQHYRVGKRAIRVSENELKRFLESSHAA